jgi:hypothetical protein
MDHGGDPMHRNRAALAAVGAFVLTATLAAPVLAAKPSKEVVGGTPEELAADSAFLTELCGFEVAASGTSRVIVHVFTDSTGAFVREIDGYQIKETLTNVATGASVTLHDVGPDRVWVTRDGTMMLAQIGRSLSGSGYIGRVVVNLDTGEVVSTAGRRVGTLEEVICAPLSQ